MIITNYIFFFVSTYPVIIFPIKSMFPNRFNPNVDFITMKQRRFTPYRNKKNDFGYETNETHIQT